MTDIFREIDEGLRRDNFAKLWARYGKYVIALVVVIVLGTAAVMGWREYERRERLADGVRYAMALDLARGGKAAAAADAFDGLARDGSGGRAMLARFEQAALKVKAGDTTAALAAYDQIAQDGSVDPAFRDLATLLAARSQLDKGDPATVIDRLKPLTDGASPWHPTALELTALAELKSGDRTAARRLYQKLADDLTAPQGARARAAEMVTALAQ